MNKNFAYDVSATTLENAMLALGQSANTNVNSGIYKVNDVTNMTKAGQWNIQMSTFDRENQITTTANQPNMASPIIRSGRMILNGNFAGMYDFAYHNGNLDCDALTNVIATRADGQLFTGNMDTHWALIYINGDLTIDGPVEIRPPVRKLGMCIYVTGDCVVDGIVTMSNRGANHSGKGSSGGYTVPVAIPLNGTLTIPATGGAGGSRATSGTGSGGDGNAGGNSNNGTAAGGSGTSTYCGSGGGGSGDAMCTVDGSAVKSGSGGTGTCFSGGSGGGSVMAYTGRPSEQGADYKPAEMDAVEYGGAGGHACSQKMHPYGSSGGAGNPAGLRQAYWSGSNADKFSFPASFDSNTGHGTTIIPHAIEEEWDFYQSAQAKGSTSWTDPQYSYGRGHNNYDGMNGTGGTVVMMIAGEYSGDGAVRSSGHTTYYYADGHLGNAGGAGGGGIAIVLYGTDDSGPTPISTGGGGGNYYAAGAGGAGTGLKAAL